MNVTVLNDRFTLSWPPDPEKDRPFSAYDYALGAPAGLELSHALGAVYQTDAHFTAYAYLGVRLNGRALDPANLPALPGGSVRMHLAVFDVDDSVAHANKTPAREEWRVEERAKLNRLWTERPGFFYFETRGGYRLLWRLEQPVALTAPHDIPRWYAFYLRWVSELAAYGIVADPACKDWTRLYRLPFVERDGKSERRPVAGNLSGGVWPLGAEPPPAPPMLLRAARERGDAELPDGVPARLIELAAPHLESGRNMHVGCRAIGGWLQGRGYDREAVRELVVELAAAAGSDNPEKRADEAAVSTSGWTAVQENFPPEVCAALEQLVPDPVFEAKRQETHAALERLSEAILAARPPETPLDQSAPIDQERLFELAKRWERRKETAAHDNAHALKLLVKGLPPGTDNAQPVADRLAVALGRGLPRASAERIAQFCDRLFDGGVVQRTAFIDAIQHEQRIAQNAEQLAATRAAAGTIGAGIVAPDGLELPIFVTRHTQAWVRNQNSTDYTLKIPKTDIAQILKEDWGGLVELYEVNDSGRSVPKTDRDLVLAHARYVREYEVRYTYTRTTFEPEYGRLVQGLRCPNITPVYNDRIHKFLGVLLGEANVPDFYQWVAACRQDYLGRAATILAMIGPPGVAKTYVSFVIAMLQGQPKPIPLKKLKAQFQSELAECNILLADEQFPKELTQAELSEYVTEPARLIEHKGVDAKVRCVGNWRIIATANSIDRLKLDGSSGPAALQALADRFSVFMIPDDKEKEIKAAQRALQPVEGQFDDEMFKQHFAWVQANIPVADKRFLGERADRSIARALIVRSDSSKHELVFDVIRDYLENGGERDFSYRLQDFRGARKQDERIERAMSSFPIWVYGNQLCINMPALDAWLGPKSESKAATESMRGRRVSMRTGSCTINGYPLETEKLFAAIPDLDVAAAKATLAVDTKDRIAKRDAERASSGPVIPGVPVPPPPFPKTPR